MNTLRLALLVFALSGLQAACTTAPTSPDAGNEVQEPLWDLQAEVHQDVPHDLSTDLSASDLPPADHGLPDLGLDLPPDLPLDTQDTSPGIDVVFDAPCQADCTDKICGNDGCGGICGYCTYPKVCDAEGLCIEVCEKNCVDKTCGPDGCGGDCGACLENFECGDDGLCYENACIPNCTTTGSTCGSDGCGGDCGLCAAPKVCGDFEQCAGYCCSLGPCGTVTETGECQGDLLVTCQDKVNLVQTPCAETPGDTCLFDPFLGVYACAEAPECVPQCQGKVCGADACDGLCGVCTTGWSCELGVCKKEIGGACGTVTSIGECEGDTYWFCVAGKLYTDDCAVFGQTCTFKNGSFGCQ